MKKKKNQLKSHFAILTKSKLILLSRFLYGTNSFNYYSLPILLSSTDILHGSTFHLFCNFQFSLTKNRNLHYQMEPKLPSFITLWPELRFWFRQRLRIQERKNYESGLILPGKGSSFLDEYLVESFGSMDMIDIVDCLN